MLNIIETTEEMGTIFFFSPKFTNIKLLIKPQESSSKNPWSNSPTLTPPGGDNTCPAASPGGPGGHPHFQAWTAFFVFSAGSLPGLQCFRRTQGGSVIHIHRHVLLFHLRRSHDIESSSLWVSPVAQHERICL